MEKILERYERYSYAERALTMTEPENQVYHLVLVYQNIIINSTYTGV